MAVKTLAIVYDEIDLVNFSNDLKKMMFSTGLFEDINDISSDNDDSPKLYKRSMGDLNIENVPWEAFLIHESEWEINENLGDSFDKEIIYDSKRTKDRFLKSLQV